MPCIRQRRWKKLWQRSYQSSLPISMRDKILFAIFCYKSAELRELLLEPWFIQHLDEHTTETQNEKCAKNFCLIMSPDDYNCPFIWLNWTFPHVSNFVTVQKACKGKSREKAICLGNPSYLWRTKFWSGKVNFY